MNRLYPVVLCVFFFIGTFAKTSLPISPPSTPPPLHPSVEVEKQKTYWEYFPRADDEISYRLPNNTEPISYTIALRTQINEGNFDFTGQVNILIRVKEASRNITIHYRNMTISETKLFNTQTPPTEIDIIEGTDYNIYSEFFVIYLKEDLTLDAELVVQIKYSSVARTDNRGVFRQYYVNEKNERRRVNGKFFLFFSLTIKNALIK